MRCSNLLSLLFIAPLLVGCSEVNSLDSSDSPGCGSNGCFNNDAANDVGTSDASPDIGNDSESEAGNLVNPLCGVLQCDPDDFEAVKCNVGGSAGGTSGDGGLPEASQDAAPDVAQFAPDAKASSDAADEEDPKVPFDVHDDIPQPDEPPSDDVGPASACQVTMNPDGDAVAMCVAGGSGVDNDPCVTSADCSAGYACVGDTNTGVCRAYCCLDPEACADGTYCGVLPSRDPLRDDPNAKFLLPVCIPASDCELLPGSGATNRCAEGWMCAIVRADGSTACVLPGVAAEGDPCEEVESGHSPCAEGFVCSKATNTCLALCRIGTTDACGNGTCQGGTDGIPQEYGVCVGARD